MSGKEQVMEVIDKAPDDASFEEIIETLELMKAIREGRDAIARGEVVPHEEVVKMVPKWIAESSGRTLLSKT
ncbi:MAG: hypothetical protein CMO43_06650 [Verrucomicrobiales bacterium]|jgi:predicted transcriptional regulator|nr:hypothetical protein [Verrucomicrobiales bacterium]MDP6752942.1 hypothetical protein [Verrucomicrobiota bacterium]MDP7013904.1 hypothetical protein [Verrucomicrobiota bacterium]|tara:strand:- start:211 stop:426 length:216 start_codon:yes stop_codon:yes gene_type:complete